MPFRVQVVKAAVSAVLALALALSTQEPAHAQGGRAVEAVASSTDAAADDSCPPQGPPAVLLIPPHQRHRERLRGLVEIQTLIVDPLITTVDFFLDGSRTGRVEEKPYTTHVRLADAPREQALEVRGYDARGNCRGNDEITLNRLDVAFSVRVTKITRMQLSGYPAARVGAAVSVPRGATLERVDFYRGQHLVEALHSFGEKALPGRPRTIAVESLLESAPAHDFVRVVAKLADGREWEDAELLRGADYRGEIDVQLVQFQVSVTDGNGNPVSNLKPEDFKVRENGVRRPVEHLRSANDVPLVLGLTLDSSGSVLPIRQRLVDVSAGFLEAALSTRDRAFLVHFNATVRVLQPLSGNKRLLTSMLRYLEPGGGTALNDAILFSLLQFRNEPGRRALVVITDGHDQHSRSEPSQFAEFAENLGLPNYLIQLESSRRSADRNGKRYVHGMREKNRTRSRLQRISQQTGGRLFTIEFHTGTAAGSEQLEQVFEKILDDLRHQHVLTYYSNQPPGAAIEPEVGVTRRRLKLRSAVPLEAIE